MTSKAGIVLFARMSSSRLPGKALLPLDGMSILEICCRRLKHPDFDLIVATSVDPSDNQIVEHCDRLGVDCFRGALDSPKDRLFSLLAEKKYDIIIRATADNVIPDSHLVRAITYNMWQQQIEYSFVVGGMKNYPYGLSLEVMSSHFLYECEKNNLLSHEHITGDYRKSNPDALFDLPVKHLAHNRLTIDTPMDYRFFQERWKSAYVGLPFMELIDKIGAKD